MHQIPPLRGIRMLLHSTPQGEPPLTDNPLLSLPALLDLLDALEVVLQAAPGLIHLFAAELRGELAAYLEARR